MNRVDSKADYRNTRYEAPEDFINTCLEQLDNEIAQLRTALIYSFVFLFSVCFGLLI